MQLFPEEFVLLPGAMLPNRGLLGPLFAKLVWKALRAAPLKVWALTAIVPGLGIWRAVDRRPFSGSVGL
jgi:hypothetical protein